jgi:hypothetical protein
LTNVIPARCHRAAQSADPLGPARNEDVYLQGNRAAN